MQIPFTGIEQEAYLEKLEELTKSEAETAKIEECNATVLRENIHTAGGIVGGNDRGDAGVRGGGGQDGEQHRQRDGFG